MVLDPTAATQPASLTDEEIVQRVLGGETALFELLMRRYNRRLYRIARAISGDAAEAEDVTQDAYVRAFEHMDQFSGRARFSTWLTRIAVHEASARVRRRRRRADIEESMPRVTSVLSPEQRAADHEIGRAIEAAVGKLPETYGAVFMLREVEGLSTADAAECLSLSEDAVKTRFFRARALLRQELLERAGLVSAELFPLHLSRCDRVVAAVLARLDLAPPERPQCGCPGDACRAAASSSGRGPMVS